MILVERETVSVTYFYLKTRPNTKPTNFVLQFCELAGHLFGRSHLNSLGFTHELNSDDVWMIQNGLIHKSDSWCWLLAGVLLQMAFYPLCS